MQIDNQTLLLIIGLLFLSVILIVALIVSNSRNKMLQAVSDQMHDLHLDMTREMNDFQMDITNVIKSDISNYNEYTAVRMASMENQVNESLRNSMEKTNQAFTDVMVKMATLQETQQSLNSLSEEITSLQNVLIDKKSRGIFGEVELYSILENSFGVNDERYLRQHKLSNGNIVDAAIVGPEPIGLIPIDSKFPLENYNRMYNQNLTKQQQESARKQFKSDCVKHIKDIATKYLNTEETSEFAYMFVPAEAVFAEIYGRYPDVIDYSYRCKVFIVSPTTLMAYITAIKAIYLGQSKNEKVVQMQQELQKLSNEFERFTARWANITKDFEKTSEDIQSIDTTAKKIVNQFRKIDNVELDGLTEVVEYEEHWSQIYHSHITGRIVRSGSCR